MLNIATPVRRRGHVVVDADGKMVCRTSPGTDPNALKDVVLALNGFRPIVDALIQWKAIFDNGEMRGLLKEIIGEDAAGFLWCTMALALSPHTWQAVAEVDRELEVAQ